MKLFITLIISCLSLFSFAQKRQNTYFLNAKNEVVEDKDSAIYYRIIQENDPESMLYPIYEFYKNGNKKKVGALSKYDPTLVYEGTVISYYENGKKSAIENFIHNGLVGTRISFYQNGVFNEQREYPSEPQTNKVQDFYKVIQVNDSLGNTFLNDNGTGRVALNYQNGNKEFGNYYEGLKDSTWKTYDANNKQWFIDEYDQGIYIHGKTVFDDGTINEYKQLGVMPEFKGGIKGFSKYLENNLIYPGIARFNKIEGTVLVAFDVGKDGSLQNIKVRNSVYPELDEEAVRVLSKSPNWSGGIFRGVPVKVSYTLPIAFRFQ